MGGKKQRYECFILPNFTADSYFSGGKSNTCNVCGCKTLFTVWQMSLRMKKESVREHKAKFASITEFLRCSSPV